MTNEKDPLSPEQRTYFDNLLEQMAQALNEKGRFEKAFSPTDITTLLSIALALGLHSKEAKAFDLDVQVINPAVQIDQRKLRFAGSIAVNKVKSVTTDIVLRVGSVASPFIEFQNQPVPNHPNLQELQLSPDTAMLLSAADPDSAMNLGQLSSVIGLDQPLKELNEMARGMLQSPGKLLFGVIQEALQKLDFNSMSLSAENNTANLSLGIKQ